ncbi:MAG: glycosyltransferase family 2 protein, partial [Actinomycetota bacterium]
DVLRSLRLKGRSFDIEAEVTAKLLRDGYRPYEIPISYNARGREEGKKISWKDGVMALWTILRIRLTSSRKTTAALDRPRPVFPNS